MKFYNKVNIQRPHLIPLLLPYKQHLSHTLSVPLRFISVFTSLPPKPLITFTLLFDFRNHGVSIQDRKKRHLHSESHPTLVLSIPTTRPVQHPTPPPIYLAPCFQLPSFILYPTAPSLHPLIPLTLHPSSIQSELGKTAFSFSATKGRKQKRIHTLH